MSTKKQLTKKTTKQVWNPNPTGSGGFGDNPQNRSDGGWKKEDSISYQYNMLIRLNSSEFDSWLEDNPADKRTIAQEMAHNALLKAKRDLSYLKEITNRTDGMPTQKTEIDGEVTHRHINYDEVLQLIHDQRTIIESEESS